MREPLEAKRIRLHAFGRHVDECIYRHAMDVNSMAVTAKTFGIAVETVRAVVADCQARRQRQKQREFA